MSSRPVWVAGEELLPTELNPGAVGHAVEVGRDRLTARYNGEGRHNADVGCVQANRPVPVRKLVYYFEMTVTSSGELGRLSIGFTEKNSKLTKQPGWDVGTYGYHGDDGRKYSGSGKGDDYGPTYTTGDTVGACIHWGRQEIFFTKNGTKLRTAFKNVRLPGSGSVLSLGGATSSGSQQGGLYPTIGMHSRHEAVEVNFGAKPFKFDIEGLLLEERAAQRQAVDRISIPPAVVHSLVTTYLAHYGYADTLAALQAATACEGLDDAPQQPSQSLPAAHNQATGTKGAGAGGAAQGPSTSGGGAGGSGSGGISSTPTRGAPGASGAGAGAGLSGGGGGAGGAGGAGPGPSSSAAAAAAATRGTHAGAHASGSGSHGSGRHDKPHSKHHKGSGGHHKGGEGGSKAAGVKEGGGGGSTAGGGSGGGPEAMAIDPPDPQQAAVGGSSGGNSLAPGPHDPTALQLRQAVRQAICRGDIDAALAAIQATFPQVLGPGFEETQLQVYCQKYIEMIRSGDILSAVMFAQSSPLARLRGLMPQWGRILTDVVALVAYEAPQSSSLSHLLSPAQREAVADAVNSALLAAAAGQGPEYKPQSPLQRVLLHAGALQGCLMELSGGQGELMGLADVLTHTAYDTTANMC